MTRLFINYDNLPENYIPNNTTNSYKLPLTHKAVKPLVTYNVNGQPTGFSWNYGDSVLLHFSITGDVWYEEQDITEPVEVYLSGKKLELNIYNFRYEVVYTIVEEASTEPVFYINRETKDLPSGTYSLSLTLKDEDDKIVTTLFKNTQCTILIK